jgi:pepF/M3 family oligoendopeptidase
MGPAEEDLYSDLQLTGWSAWSKLHSNVTSQLTAVVKRGKADAEELPMSAVRGLAHDPEEAVRRAAYETELEAWEKVAVPIAAALNSIKGEVNTVATRRGWKDPLEAVLFRNNTDRQTLEAMQEACVESFPDFRRYLKAKAKLIGKDSLAWWDLFAPVGSRESQKRWSFPEATEFIVEQFGSYSERLASLADRAFRERWVDAEPRLGKVDGAFCMWIRKGESRVLSNFEPSFDSVHTLAHELGHAYHNLNLADRTPMNRETPMALAETASIFCQTIITNAALSTASNAEKISILENDLQDACQVVVDIHSRFLFERGVFDSRLKRELSIDEFKELILDAQRQTYGEGLDPDALHPFMWVVKGHYYGSSYYNWPYTFGLLFGLGLYAQYRRKPDEFRAGYDDLLSSTGLDDAAALTGRFGFDIRTVDFWRSSLDLIRERVTEFETLATG